MFKKFSDTAHSFVKTDHDPLCIGSVAWGACDCEMIEKIREDEQQRTHMNVWNEGYSLGYMHGRRDAAKTAKRRLKGLKKSFRKSVVQEVRGPQ